MKVVLVTPMLPPALGGPGVHASMMAAFLQKEGEEVSVANFAEVLHLPPLLRHVIFFFRIARAARGADVVYVLEAVSTGVPARAAARLFGLPYVVRTAGLHAWEQGVQREGLTYSLDEFVAAYAEHPETFSRRVRRWMRLQCAVVRGAAACVVPSKYFAGLYAALGIPRDAVRVVYSAYTPRFGAEGPALKREAYHVVSAGRLVPWKGFPALVEALARARRRFPEARLTIAGEGPARAAIEAAIERCGVQDAVTLSGALSQDALSALLARAGVFALNTAYEGLSHQLLEAMDAGIPIVTTAAGGNEELMAKGAHGILFPFNDVPAIEAALSAVWHDPALARVRAERARRFLTRFEAEARMRDLYGILRGAARLKAKAPHAT